MRIKIIGNNDCARATRDLLRKAGFAVRERWADAEPATAAPDAGYLITIKLTQETHPGFPAPATPPESAGENMLADPASVPDLTSHGKPTPGLEGTSAAAPPATDVPSPASEEAGYSCAVIHFDSVDGALEAAVMRHVTQLWYGPVMVDRPGGRVHHERELRIVVPAENDAAASAVEFGVLRGLLDLSGPFVPQDSGPAVSHNARAEVPQRDRGDLLSSGQAAPERAPSRNKRWWMLWAFFLIAHAMCARSVKANPDPEPAPAPTPEQIAAWRLAFALPQGQQATGVLFESVYDSGNLALKVNCVVGCSATSGFSDNAAFTVGSTTINVLGGYYTSGGAPSISSGNAGRLRMDSSSYLYVDCTVGCSGSSFADEGTFTFGTTPISLLGCPFQTTSSNNGLTNGQAGAAQCTSDRKLFTQAFQGTSPWMVSNGGTFAVQAAQSGTWNIGTVTTLTGITNAVNTNADTTIGGTSAPSKEFTVGGKTNDGTPQYQPIPEGAGGRSVIVEGVNGGTAVKVDGSGVTQPVSAASLPLPTNAATSANQCGSSSGAACFAIGTLADNGAAAGTNRIGVLPGIAESNYPSAETAGRDSAHRTDLQGNALVSQLPEASFASYEAAAAVSSAASATDIAVISGNATNTVMVTRLVVSCTQTTAGIITLYITKHSSADTGGTSSSMTAVPMDSGYAAASTAALTYTANKTGGGTVVGNIDVADVGCMASGTASPNDIYVLNLWQKPIVLRGTAQQLAVNLNGATVTGGSFAVRFEWIETTGL